MKREDVTKIFGSATDEQINSILDINSADIGKAKGDFENIKSELSKAKTTIETLTAEAETLRTNGASAEEWQKRYEDLDKRIKEEKAQLEAERSAKEKAEAIQNRFNAVCLSVDGKPLKWSHEAIGQSYLSKFTEALNDKAYEGKSDKDIFYDLTKDDKDAFKGVDTNVILAGGKPLDTKRAEPSSLLGALKQQYNKGE